MNTTEITPDDIKKVLAENYGGGYTDRDLSIHPVVNHYEMIGSVYFSLDGSPPKGHAIYIGGNVGTVVFMDGRGDVFKKLEGVELAYPDHA